MFSSDITKVKFVGRQAESQAQVRRRKHDSTDTVDSASSYECRFERLCLDRGERERLLREKNKQWSLVVSRAEEDLISVGDAPGEPLVAGDTEPTRAR
jgi:hypothetical protein